MTSRDDALPANFMGASLKGGKLTDLRKYLREVESKQKELLNDSDPDQEPLLSFSNTLIFNLKAMIDAKQKEVLADLMGDGECDVAKAAPVAGKRRARGGTGAPPLEDVPKTDRAKRMAAQYQRADVRDMILGASQRNDVKDIRYLVEKMKVDPSHANRMGQSALHVASLWGNAEAVDQLLRYNANVHAQNKMGHTPLHSIMMTSKGTVPRLLQCLNLLLESGANPNMLDQNGNTPKDYWSGKPEERCLVNALLPPPSPLFLAIEQGDENKVQQMILGTEVKVFGLQSEGGKKLNGKIGKVLTQEVNQDGRHQVQVKGIQQVKLIKPTNLESLAGRSSVLAERYMGFSPLLFTADLILEERRNPTEFNMMVSLVGILKLLCAEGHRNGKIDSSTLLVLEDGADDKDKRPSPLLQLCTDIQDLHENGSASEMEIRVMEEICSLLVPFSVQEKKIIQMFHTACRKNLVALAHFFLEVVQIDPNVHGQGGMTALHFAARSGCTNMAQFLLQTGKVDATLQDNMGRTPMDAAKANQKHDVIAVLEQHMKGKAPDAVKE